jgi:hypothetical protein
VKNILSKGGLFMLKKSNLPFFFRATGILLVLMAFLAGCEDEPSPSNEKNITAFKIGNAAGAIYGEKSKIHIVLPAGTALETLSPEISVSSGASVSPKSGDPVDLTFPQTFTVTAENGSIRPYVVSASLATGTDPLKLEIGFPAAEGAGLEVYGDLPTTGVVRLSVHEQSTLKKSILISVGGKNGEVYNSDDYVSSIQWSVDGVELFDSDNIITIRAADYAYTIPHTLTIIATKDGVRYSRSIQFTVER